MFKFYIRFAWGGGGHTCKLFDGQLGIGVPDLQFPIPARGEEQTIISVPTLEEENIGR